LVGSSTNNNSNDESQQHIPSLSLAKPFLLPFLDFQCFQCICHLQDGPQASKPYFVDIVIIIWIAKWRDPSLALGDNHLNDAYSLNSFS
jgi:hypothetical protein